MNHLLCGLAANPALPSELVDRLLTRALEEAGTCLDRDYADELLHDLTDRTDLRRDQVLALGRLFRILPGPARPARHLAALSGHPSTSGTRAPLRLARHRTGRPGLIRQDPKETT